jgi:hypothetical protein
MLREQRPRAKAYLCYGAPGQGVNLFLERILVQLREDLGQGLAVQPQSLEWPEHLHDPSRAFETMFRGAFRVRVLEDIPTRVEHEAGWQAGRQTLLYLRHAPVSLPGSPIRAEALKQYLEWWDATVAPVLRGRAIFVLLCIPIEAREPQKFSEKLAQVFSGKTLRLDETYAYVLGELGHVTMDDLHHFVDTHNIPMPEARKRDELFKKVIDETGGRYEPTLERLKEIDREYWRAGPSGSGSPAAEPGADEDY